MDLNALVAENRTWLQFLMEQASDLHLSYLLEASVSQVSRFLKRALSSLLVECSFTGYGPYFISTSTVLTIDFIFIVTKIMQTFENNVNMNQQQLMYFLVQIGISRREYLKDNVFFHHRFVRAPPFW
jgi:hypothetical protein